MKQILTIIITAHGHRRKSVGRVGLSSRPSRRLPGQARRAGDAAARQQTQNQAGIHVRMAATQSPTGQTESPPTGFSSRSTRFNHAMFQNRICPQVVSPQCPSRCNAHEERQTKQIRGSGRTHSHEMPKTGMSPISTSLVNPAKIETRAVRCTSPSNEACPAACP